MKNFSLDSAYTMCFYSSLFLFNDWNGLAWFLHRRAVGLLDW